MSKSTDTSYNMVYMNEDEEFIDSELPAVVRNGEDFLFSDDFIPFPEGSSLIYLPGACHLLLLKGRSRPWKVQMKLSIL
ncbi:MAG: hypothetical protein WCS44_02540 [Bacillota bacterium]